MFQVSLEPLQFFEVSDGVKEVIVHSLFALPVPELDFSIRDRMPGKKQSYAPFRSHAAKICTPNRVVNSTISRWYSLWDIVFIRLGRHLAHYP